MKTPSEKIRQYSRLLKAVTYFLIVLLPLLNAGFWVSNGYPNLPNIFHFDYIPKIDLFSFPSLADMTGLHKLCAFCVSMIPTSIGMIALYYFAKLLSLYEKLQIFTLQNTRWIKRIGFTLLIGQIIYPFYFAFMTLVMSITNNPGERFISLAFGFDQLLLIGIALLILLVSYIMQEGQKLKDEVAYTI